MLNAVAIANHESGAGRKLAQVNLPFQQTFEADAIDWRVCLQAELIVMLGGDGTLQHTTTELLHYLADTADSDPTAVPPLAVVPFGTTNMSARTINRSRTRKQTLNNLETVLQQHSGNRLPVRHHRLLEIRNGSSHLYGFALGLGAVTELVEEWRQGRSDAALLNRLRSLFTLVRGVSSADRGVPVMLNGTSYDLYVLVLTTLAEVIYGFTPFWNTARDTDAVIRCTWIEAGTPDLLLRAPALLRGAPQMAALPGFGSAAFTELNLQLDNAFVLDGEIYQPQAAEISITSHDSLRWMSL